MYNCTVIYLFSVSQFQFILKEIGQHEFWTPSSIQSRISKFLCNEKDIRKWRRGRRNGRRNNNSGATLEIDGQRLPLSCKIPMNVIFLIAGFSEGQMDKVNEEAYIFCLE